MTISTTTQRATFTGTGANTALPLGFKFYASSELVVTSRTTSTGVESTLTLGTHYTVTGGNGETGTVTPVDGAADFPTTVTWTITRSSPQTQTLDLAQNDPFPAESLEAAVDKVVLQMQDLQEQVARSLKYPKTDATNLDSELPSSIDRASEVLDFDANGNVTTVAQLDQSANTVTPTGGTTARTHAALWSDVQNVRSHGATGDGSTDDTAAVQAAFAIGGSIFAPAGTYIIDKVAITKDFVLYGEGDSTIFKRKADSIDDANHGMFTAAAQTGLRGTFLDLAIDMDEATQTDLVNRGQGIRWDVDGASRAQPAKLTCERVTFSNHQFDCINAEANPSAPPYSFLDVSNCVFLGGRDSDGTLNTAFIHSSNTTYFNIHGCMFDFGKAPTVVSLTGGTGGIFATSSAPVNEGRGTVTNCTFINCGNNVVGSIDAYAAHVTLTFSNNRLIDCYTRGINIKGGVSNWVCSGNSIVGFNSETVTGAGSGHAIQVASNSTDTTIGTGYSVIGNTIKTCIGSAIGIGGGAAAGPGESSGLVVSGNVIDDVQDGVAAIGVGITTQAGENLTITGNVIQNCDGSGIRLSAMDGVVSISGNIIRNTGRTIESAGITVRTGANNNDTCDFLVIGNFIKDGNGSNSEAVFLTDVRSAHVMNNVIEGMTGSCIRIDTTTQKSVVSGNVVIDTATPLDIDISGGSNADLQAYGNTFRAGVPSTVTIATGAVTIYEDQHKVAGEGSASDTLSTINGGRLGQMLVLEAEDDADTITLDEAGNILLSTGASVALDDTDDKILLYWNGTKWFELSFESHA